MESLTQRLQERFPGAVVTHDASIDEVAMVVPPSDLRVTAMALRDESDFRFEQLIDLCGVDYLAYGDAEWVTELSTDSGFSRGVDRYDGSQDADRVSARRIAAVYQLLSIEHNQRLRLRVFCAESEFPMMDSVVSVWPCADWYEREAFDLFGIHFVGHPDLRRILTDYGFIGHPFRKDFPLTGNVEVIYDPVKGRVVYQPVSIEPRTLVPKVIRAAVAERNPIQAPEGSDRHA